MCILFGRFGFQWPESLECSKFPVSGLCVGENKTEHVDGPGRRPNEPPGGGGGGGGIGIDGTFSGPGGNQGGNYYPNRTNWNNNNKRYGVECPKKFHVSTSYDYTLRIDHNVQKNCGMPCKDDIFFVERERLFAKYWIGVSSVFEKNKGLLLNLMVYHLLDYVVFATYLL